MIFTQKNTAATEEMEIIAEEEVVEDLVGEVATEEETATVGVAVSTVVGDHLNVVDQWGKSFSSNVPLLTFQILFIILKFPPAKINQIYDTWLEMSLNRIWN